MSKTKIDFDQYKYDLQVSLDAKVLSTYNNLKSLGEQALGEDKVDMNALLKADDSSQFIINEYNDLYLQSFPPHLDREHLFLSQTKVSIEAIQQLKIQLNTYISKMGKYKPTINALGVTSNIKKSEFNIYLDESKKDHYNALNNLIDAIEEMKQYNGVSATVYLVRAFPDLLMKGTDVIIDISKFR